MKHVALFIGLLLSTGCTGYMTASEAFRTSMTRSDSHGALARVNEALGVTNDLDLPEQVDADTPLLLLERGTILQALGRYEASAKNFQFADKSLDVLDLSKDTLGSISKYMFSDDATAYKAPPHEKLLLNTVNMINYLALGNISGAQVEARRFVVNRKFLETREESEVRSMLALGSYLSGLTFEIAGESDIAMRHYADAYQAGGTPTLKRTAQRLAALTGALDSRLKTVIDPEQQESPDEMAELVVIVQTGMTPYRYAERMPIGPAVVYASSRGSHHRLSAKQQRQANRFAAKGLLKWVNYPNLRTVKMSSSAVGARVGNSAVEGGVALDVESAAVKEFDRVRGTLIAAAITRLITRAIAGNVGESIGTRATGSRGMGFLLGLLLEGAMTAADTPDTRGWVTLPARFSIYRTRVPAGSHTLEVTSGGHTRKQVVQAQPGGWHVLNFSQFR